MQKFKSLAIVFAIGIFLLLFLVFDWSFIVSLLISGGILAAALILLEPIPKIGDTELLNVIDGERFQTLYNQAAEKLDQIKDLTEKIENQEIKERAEELNESGQTIMAYLERYPEKISSVEHFLDYYIETAYKIINSYQEIESLQRRKTKLRRLKDETLESIEYLIYIFDQHYEGLQQQTLTELTLENELLESTLQQSVEEIRALRDAEKEKVK